MQEKELKYYKIIDAGVSELKDGQFYYTQKEILEKINALASTTYTASTLTKSIKKGTLSRKTYKTISDSIQKIMKSELNMTWDEANTQFKLDHDETWSQDIIIVPEKNAHEGGTDLKIYADGRLTVPEKAAFIKQAQKEVILFGLRLNQFAEYFTKQNESVYKKHVENALKSGVNFYCYLLDPDRNAARFYFEDLAKVFEKERKSIETIQNVIKELLVIKQQFQDKGYKGQLYIYKYDHIPSYYLNAIDPTTANGKMQFSPYLYGILRSNCPVLTFSKQAEPQLFKKYWTSFKQLTKDAQLIEK